MALQRVQITDFRCLESLDLQFDPRLTVIAGNNGAGKTSVLEAVYLLGRGRSFRTRRMEPLIRAGTNRFMVVGQTDGVPVVRLGVEGSEGGLHGRRSGAPVNSMAELALLLPVQIIDPDIHRLIDEGPLARRQFLDWGTFHVEREFVPRWQRYQRALKQRNAALRSGATRTLVSSWDEELAQHGEWISGARSRYLQQLSERAGALVRELLTMDLELTYRTGWPGKQLAAALSDQWASDQERKTTSAGPHRADMAIFLEGRPVKDRISRGQQKLLAAALSVAQLTLMSTESGPRPVLLLDDPAAELDPEKLQVLVRAIANTPTQVLVTTLSSAFAELGQPGRSYRLLAGSLIASD